MPSPDAVRRWSALDHLECPRCGATYDAFVLQGVCPARRVAVAGALRPRPGRRASPARRSRRGRRTCGATTSCCRSREPEHVVTLGEGMTPLLPAPTLRRASSAYPAAGQGRGPAADRVVQGARRRGRCLPGARSSGATRLAMPTNGNAGAAWSTYAARAGLGVTDRDAGRRPGRSPGASAWSPAPSCTWSTG